MSEAPHQPGAPGRPQELPASGTAPSGADSGTQVRIVLLVVLLANLGQFILSPVIAPLAREVHLAEWKIGLTISLAALMVFVTSKRWGRRSQSLGRRSVLRLALVGAFVASTAFALVVSAGMKGAIGLTALFALFLLLRGIGFGASLSAIIPTAQAFIVDVTAPGPARVKGLAGLGAVQGISMVLGALVGGVLAGSLGLRAPLFALPLMLVAALLLVQFVLRDQPASELVAAPAKVSWRDPRVFPFLAAGFAMFMGLGFIQLISGFMVQDRSGISGAAASAYTGAVLLAAGLAIAVAQAVIVPRSGWTPPQLLRNGMSVALLGLLGMVPNFGWIGLAIAAGVMGLGMGIAMPGYTSGPTMLVRRDEQGDLAGLSNATSGLTFVISPALSSALYQVWHTLPVVVGAAMMACGLAVVTFHPRIRAYAPLHGH